MLQSWTTPAFRCITICFCHVVWVVPILFCIFLPFSPLMLFVVSSVFLGLLQIDPWHLLYQMLFLLNPDSTNRSRFSSNRGSYCEFTYKSEQ